MSLVGGVVRGRATSRAGTCNLPCGMRAVCCPNPCAAATVAQLPPEHGSNTPPMLPTLQCVPEVGCGGGYKQYCARCTPTKSACTLCNGGRSTSGGVCSLACRQLFGIGCRKCTAVACTDKDPAYSNGRR